MVQGFRVSDGNTNWYQIAQSPWNYSYYASADAFYNNGQTSGSLHGTPWVDPSVPACGSGVVETAGSSANTWTNYTNAGGSQGPTIGSHASVHMACKLQGFKVQDGNVWWYKIADPPWNGAYYVSADAFYNNGQTSGSLQGTPFVDNAVPDCGPPSSGGAGGTNETTGGVSNTWTDYNSAGGTQGPSIGGGQTVSIACKIQGFRVADGNTWWYRIAQNPWNGAYYVSADAFYNNGATSGSLRGTPFVDTSVPDCTQPGSTGGGGGTSTTPPGGTTETTGGVSHTWTNYTNAGGTRGPDIGGGTGVLIACKLTGFQVADGNTWWYQIASSPWNGSYYVSADAFYNNGATSGSLHGTPFVDAAVPDCAQPGGGGSSGGSGHPSGETAGGVADTFGNYSHAGAKGANQVPAGATIQITCRTQGFRVADGNTWWYLIASAPWNNVAYVSADAFYNNGATSGSLHGTPFYDPAVPVCVNNQETPLYSTGYGSTGSTRNRTSCGAADPVNCASGNFSHDFTDISIPERGNPLTLTRTYNSLQPGTAGLFGNGWSSSIDEKLNLSDSSRAADGSIVATLNDGSQITATPDGSGGFTTPASSDTAFKANGDGTYTLTRHSLLKDTFSATGQIQSSSDLNGDTTNYAYNASGVLTTVTDPAGRIVQVNVGPNGMITSVTDPMGRTTTYTYDTAGNLTSSSDPMSRQWNFSYNTDNRMVTMTNPRGGVVTNAYDPTTGRVLQQTDAAGLTTTFAYTGDNFSSLGGTTTITDPHGSHRVEQYADGFLTQVTKGFGTPQQATWTYTYDPQTYGTTSITDPNGHVTTRTFSNAGVLTSQTDPLGHTTTTTYNGLNEPLVITKPSGATTTNTYDPNGNLTSTTDAMGAVATYAYADSAHPGDPTSTTTPNGNRTSYTYDTSGDPASTTLAPSTGVTNVTRSIYDADGELICSTTPTASASGVTCVSGGLVTGARTVTYDPDGEQTSVTDAMGDTTTYSYDADGNRTQVTDPAHDTTTTTYDPDDRPATQTTGVGGSTPSTTTDTYDLAPGHGGCPTDPAISYCTTTTDPNGHNTVNAYDVLDNRVERQLPGGVTTTWTYDNAGNKLTQTDAANNTTSYGYDAANRLTSVSYSDGTTPNVTYAYDADSNRTDMTDGTGTTHTTYDADERITSVTDGASDKVSYGYDLDGDVTTLTYPGARTVTRTYDGADQLVSLTDWLGHTTAFTYDRDGNLTKTAYPNATNILRTYDSEDDLASLKVTNNAAKSLLAITNTRDPDHRITNQQATGAIKSSTPYTYDDHSRVATATGNAYAYDTDGSPTTLAGSARTYDNDQLTAATTASGSSTFGFNQRGDRTSQVDSTGVRTTYTYDQADRLTQVARTVPSSPTVASVSPTTASPTGGDTITINGASLTGATSVRFGITPAPHIQIINDGQIQATAPAHAAGKVHVTVVTPHGTSTPGSTDYITYKNPVPAVVSLSPSSGPLTGGTAVVLTGTHLTGTTSVAFGKVKAASFTVDSDTQITAITAPEKAGSAPVTVTTPSGKSLTITAPTFNFTNTPSGFSASPAAVLAAALPAATGSGGTGLTSLTETYSYNGDGLRMSKTATTGTADYVYDTTTSSIPTVLDDGVSTYVYGPGGQPIEQITDGVPTYFVQDAIGSTRALLDGAAKVIATYTYNPYGAVDSKTGTAATPLEFAGTYSDATGLDYAINRYYDPPTAEFLTVDSLRDVSSAAYEYTADDPINKVDPQGELPWSSIGKYASAAAGIGLAGVCLASGACEGVAAVAAVGWGLSAISVGFAASDVAVNCSYIRSSGSGSQCLASSVGLGLAGFGVVGGQLWHYGFDLIYGLHATTYDVVTSTLQAHPPTGGGTAGTGTRSSTGGSWAAGPSHSGSGSIC